jgi:hypothetical protein
VLTAPCGDVCICAWRLVCWRLQGLADVRSSPGRPEEGSLVDATRGWTAPRAVVALRAGGSGCTAGTGPGGRSARPSGARLPRRPAHAGKGRSAAEAAGAHLPCTAGARTSARRAGNRGVRSRDRRSARGREGRRVLDGAERQGSRRDRARLCPPPARRVPTRRGRSRRAAADPPLHLPERRHAPDLGPDLQRHSGPGQRPASGRDERRAARERAGLPACGHDHAVRDTAAFGRRGTGGRGARRGRERRPRAARDRRHGPGAADPGSAEATPRAWCSSAARAWRRWPGA